MYEFMGVFISLLVPTVIYLSARWLAGYNEIRSVQRALNKCTLGYVQANGTRYVWFENLWYGGGFRGIYDQVEYQLSLGQACYVKLGVYNLDNLVVDTEDFESNLYFVQDYKQFDKFRYSLKPTSLYRVYFSLNRLSEYFIDIDNPQQHELDYVRMILPKEKLKLYKEFKND